MQAIVLIQENKHVRHF